MKPIMFLAEVMMAAMLAGFALAQPSPKTGLDKAVIKQTIEAITVQLDSNYIFPETARKMNQLLLIGDGPVRAG